MKKLLVLTLAVAVLGFAGVASAYDGDFEMSGHIDTGMGWQYNGKAAVDAFGGIFAEEGMVAPDFTMNAASELTNNSTWLFYVGDVELDIAKTFGENIRLRTDLDFWRANSNGFGTWSYAQILEQAYATVNIPVGYGIEFLIGRFNAPMGFEAVDNIDNDLPFHTMIYTRVRPQNLTGIKFYYPFSDLIDLHLWIANNLRDVTAGTDGSMPAFGLRLGFTWGMEGQESTFGMSGAFSPESGQIGNKWDDWSWLGDIDFNIWVNDVFAIGGEGIFRRDGAAKNAVDNYYYGGLLNLHYVFSDVWDGTLRYAYLHDVNGSNSATSISGALNGGVAIYTGAANLNAQAAANQFHTYTTDSATGWDAQYHSVDLGVNYHITDGAKIGTMYRFDFFMPDKHGVAKTYANFNKTGMAQSIAANFGYEF